MDPPSNASTAADRPSHKPLMLILLLTAILQAAIIARMPTVAADGTKFIHIARELARDPAQAFRENDQHPGYPAMVLAATRVVQGFGYREEPEAWILGSRLITYACGVLSVWVVWLLARDLWDASIANIAALIFAVLPVPRVSAADALSDTPHLFAYLLAAWLASSAIVTGNLTRLAGAAAASGVAYWIRPEGLEVVLVAGACVAWQTFRGNWPWRRGALALATLAGMALLIVAPYAVLAGKVTSKQVPFAKAEPTPTFLEDQLATARAVATLPSATQAPGDAQAAAPAAPTEPVDTKATVNSSPVPGNAAETAPMAPTDDAVATATADPPKTSAEHARVPAALSSQPVDAISPMQKALLVLKVAGKSLNAFANSFGQGFKIVFLPFFWVGNIVMIRRGPGWFKITYMWGLAMLHVVVMLGVFILSGYIAHRHLLLVVALAMPVTGLGVLYTSERLAAWFKSSPAYAVAAIMGICSLIVLPYTLRSSNREFLPVIAATRWVEEHAPPGSGIVANSPYVGFYGSLPVTSLNPKTPTIATAVAGAPVAARYDFAVLHVGAFQYRAEWIDELKAHYQVVQSFADPTNSPQPRKVLVFQAIREQVRRPRRGPHS